MLARRRVGERNFFFAVSHLLPAAAVAGALLPFGPASKQLNAAPDDPVAGARCLARTLARRPPTPTQAQSGEIASAGERVAERPAARGRERDRDGKRPNELAKCTNSGMNLSECSHEISMTIPHRRTICKITLCVHKTHNSLYRIVSSRRLRFSSPHAQRAAAHDLHESSSLIEMRRTPNKEPAE